jgi:hypothetical protein
MPVGPHTGVRMFSRRVISPRRFDIAIAQFF